MLLKLYRRFHWALRPALFMWALLNLVYLIGVKVGQKKAQNFKANEVLGHAKVYAHKALDTLLYSYALRDQYIILLDYPYAVNDVIALQIKVTPRHLKDCSQVLALGYVTWESHSSCKVTIKWIGFENPHHEKVCKIAQEALSQT